MIRETGLRYRLADAFLYLLLLALGLLCIFPFVHVIALSLSGKNAVTSNLVGLWPIDFHVENFRFLMGDDTFVNSFGVSVLRVLVGVTLGLLVMVITAYPLSRDAIHMPGRTLFKMLMLFGLMFSGGLIPLYLALRNLGLLNSFWVMIVPRALNVFYAILIINFFRGIPQELYDAAVLDGANHLQVLFRVFVPISKPVIATVALFSAVEHWNSWFDGVIFLNESSKWPLQSYLFNRVISRTLQWQTSGGAERAGQSFLEATPEGLATTMVLIAAIPILLVYPFLQRYFVQGLTLGSVKE